MGTHWRRRPLACRGRQGSEWHSWRPEVAIHPDPRDVFSGILRRFNGDPAVEDALKGAVDRIASLC